MTYDPDQNAKDSYTLAIASIRAEKLAMKAAQEPATDPADAKPDAQEPVS